ncbi:hypothetical protein P1J78_01770 [Psychromarinibacter sp. C21-152]|uniref:Uncharacterized protein n=1 Tax=Psychromarinibacter sediminicola TaxID=3033385 RepID=A0AAE3NKA9_9RHOB|nr:hypothetical protein [Psychromarinibacter sediminicola]MDF0599448.1 hypothetical protein [Psychromarinibacter sediminicola]
MVGNSAEEGVLQQLRHPSHSDPARIVALAALVAGLLAGWGAWAWIPGLAFVGALAFGLLVCIGVAWTLGRRVAAQAEARRGAELEAQRRAETAAADLALARMKETGK